MIVEKKSRFFRLYDLVTTSRRSKGRPLPIIGEESLMSIFDAAVKNGTASIPQKNRDTVELVKVSLNKKKTHLALLFHRANPDAPAPMFRSRTGNGINLRHSEGEEGEEQAYSAHMLIDISNVGGDGIYRMALEEIPGLSASAVVGVLRSIAMQAEYECEDDRGYILKTYTVIKCDGYSSESLSRALENGRIDYIDLWKDPDEELEQDGAYVPSREKVTLKAYEPITKDNFVEKIKNLLTLSEQKGYSDVKVRIDFDDDRRSRIVSIDRKKEATEIFFVRSKLFSFDEDLDVCYVDFNRSILAKAKEYLSESSKP